MSPRSLVAHALGAADLRTLLARAPQDFGGADPLVIKRIDYYFHHAVFAADFSRPNVYLPFAAWEAQVAAASGERVGSDRIYETIRNRAYANREETILNTHPIVFIGANSKGLELLISPPGARNQDSHGSYPFPGL